MVWEWLGDGLGMAWGWFGNGLGKLRERFGKALGTVWECARAGSGMVVGGLGKA